MNGAGGGKSILGCYWQIKNRLKYPNTKGLIGRASLKTLKETTLQSFFWVAKEQGLKAGIHYKYNQQSNIIYFPNESQILLKDLFLYPSDPNFDELGSLEITDAFIDECNQVVEKAKNIVKSRIRYRLDENGLIPKVLMTCNPAKNWTYQQFFKPDQKGELPENRKFIQSLLGDNPNISKFYLENLLSLDEASKQRLLYGNWDYDNDPSKLIDFENINNCFTNSFVETGTKYITADIARFGKDKTVIVLWNGYRAKINVYAKLSITESAGKIKELSDREKIPMSNVIVDEDGVGGGVKDILNCKGFVNNSVPIALTGANGQKENFGNLKSQCYFKLADRINKQGVFIDCTDIEIREFIVQELDWVKRKDPDKDGKLYVLPKDVIKDNIGRSPDYADALMMREWFDLMPKIEWKFY